VAGGDGLVGHPVFQPLVDKLGRDRRGVQPLSHGDHHTGGYLPPARAAIGMVDGGPDRVGVWPPSAQG
jgi:hypothetical protein